MKNLSHYILEKLNLDDDNLIPSESNCLEKFKFGQHLLSLYTEKFGLHLDKINFLDNEEAHKKLKNILNEGDEHIIYFFEYLLIILEEYEKDDEDIDDEFLLKVIEETDLSDFEDWELRLT